MIAVITLFIKVLFCGFSIFGSLRGLVQLNQYKHSKFVQFVFYIGLITYSIGLFIENVPVHKVSLSLLQGSFLSVLILLLVDQISRKKDKVSWRIPLIFALVAYNFSAMEVELAFCASEVLLLVVIWFSREKHNYVYRQQFKSAIVAGFMFLSFVYDDILFLIGLLLIINMKFQIMNALKLKIKMSSEND